MRDAPSDGLSIAAVIIADERRGLADGNAGRGRDWYALARACAEVVTMVYAIQLRQSAIDRYTIFRQTLVNAYLHNCLGIAKGAAYSALLSFFPVLTTLAAILVQANAAAVARGLSSLVFQVVPPGTEDVVLYNFTQRGQRPTWLLIAATVLCVWAASGVMMSLME